MKFIKKITDQDILGTEGLSTKKPRITARAILKNGENRYAVMYSEEFQLYSLPGGGVKPDEEVSDAIKREIWEETGCDIATMEELGYIEENRGHCDYTQINYYFILTTNDEQRTPHLTANEMKHGMTVLWVDFAELYRHIVSVEHPTNQRKFLQARDIAALEEYIGRQHITM